MKKTMQERLDQWKQRVEELRLQANLGEKEAREAFEVQKKNLAKWAEDMKEKVGGLAETGSEKTTQLKTNLEELRVQAALGAAEGRDKLEEQEAELRKRMRKLEEGIPKAFEASADRTKEFAEDFSEELDDFYTRFDLFRLQMNLGRKEAQDTLEEKQKVLRQRLQDLNLKLDKGREVAGDKWGKFSAEMKEAWKHIKEAVS
jgi:hypothetical protein